MSSAPKFFSFVLALALGASSSAQAAGKCDSVIKKWKPKCSGGIAAATAHGNGAQVRGDGMSNQAGQQAALMQQQGQLAGAAGQTCGQAAEACKGACTGEEAKKCEAFEQAAQAANGAAGQMGQTAPQSQQTSQSAGGGGDMSGMIGALAGGLIGAMMAKKAAEEEEKKKQQQQQQYLGALQSNGTLDCSKPDAYVYADCDPYLAQLCTQKMNSGQYMNNGVCPTFAGRFCSGTPGAAVPVASQGGTMVTESGTIAGMPPMGVPGAGLSTNPQFCQSVLAYNFCQQPGRSQCPSCLQLADSQSPACLSNPALCLAQGSVAQAEQAKQTCPTDPMFSSPAYVATLGTGGATGAPAVVLPQSKSANAAVGGGGMTQVSSSAPVASASRPNSSASSQAQVQSATPAAPVESGARREGQAHGPGSDAAGGGGLGRPGARDVAATGGLRPASVAGPAPDIQSEFGPSLFATGTQVIRSRCMAGKFYNCP